MRIISEINSYFKLREQDSTPNKVVFYSEDIESYCHFEGLISELSKKKKISIIYITSDFEDFILKKKNNAIIPLYFDKLLAPVIKNLKAKAIIMTMPEIDKFHIKKSIYCNEHIYIFHNIGSSFTAIKFGALFSYDTLFCVGPHHKIETLKQEKLYDLKNKKLIDFGYYKLERILKEYSNYKKDSIKHKNINDNIKILIAPSWGNNSIFNLCGEQLIDTLLASDYVLYIRPHPMTLKKDHELINNLKNKYKDNKNIIFEDDISETKSFYFSDLMITDWSGVSYEFAFGTERPVLFIDVPQKIMNEQYREIGIDPIDISIRNKIGRIIPVKDLNKIKKIIDDLITNKKEYRKSILNERKKSVYNLGSSSKKGCDYILSLIN